MLFKKHFLFSLITLSSIGSSITAEEKQCTMDCQCEHFSWAKREVNGVPGLIIQCKKQLPASLQKTFDDSLERWQTYLHENQGDFDIETLLKAVSFAATRNDEETLRHLLGSTMLLWDVGHVRSINILAASLVRDSGATLEQIEWQFGSEVRRVVEELSNFPKFSDEKAPFLSLSAQLIILSDRLENFRKHKNLSSVDQERKMLHGLRGTSDALERLYESYLDEVAAKG